MINARKFGFTPALTLKSTTYDSAAQLNSDKDWVARVMTFIVPTKKYTLMATVIVSEHDETFQVPVSFCVLLDRAIAIRKHYSTYLPPRNETPNKAASDSGPLVLLDVLTKVRDILKPLYPSDYKTQIGTFDSFSELGTMPPKLEIDPASTGNNGGRHITFGEEILRYEAELSCCIEEDIIAFQLFLSDLRKLRSEVARVWEEYKWGLVDIVTASLVTDTAVYLARSLEDECKEYNTKRVEPQELFGYVHYGITLAHKTTSGSADFDSFQHAGVSIFHQPFTCLATFLDLQKPEFASELLPSDLKHYDPKGDRASKTFREKHHEDQHIILNMLSDIAALTTEFEQSPAEDELTLVVRTVFKTREVTISAAFALQLFLDIHHTLRDKADSAFRRLSDVASFARKNIKETLRFHDGLQTRKWSSQDEQKMTSFSDCIFEYILSDPHRVACNKLRRELIRPPYYFLRNHPWACGLWKFYIQAQLHTIGLSLIGTRGAVKSCVHLYNAMCQEDLLDYEWPDMQLLFKTRDSKSLFGGDAPRCPEDYRKNFKLDMSDALKEMAPVMLDFKRKYCAVNPNFKIRTSDVKRIIHQYRWQNEVVKGRPATGFEYGPKKGVFVSKFLSLLRATVEHEILELSFDYLTFDRACWSLLRSLKDKHYDLFVTLGEQSTIDDGNQLPRIVGYILIIGTMDQTHPALKDTKTVVEEMLKTDQAAVVEKVLKEKFGTAPWAVKSEDGSGESSDDTVI